MYLFIFLIVLPILLFIGGLLEAPWVPTKKNDFERIAKLATLKPGMLLYDLGSGSSEMLFYLSRTYNINCVGIEISPILYIYSKIKSLFYRKVKILFGNFYRHNVSRADVVYIFLMPKTFDKLERKLNEELRESSKVIISCWPLKNFTPLKTSEVDNEITYYLYNKAALLSQGS